MTERSYPFNGGVASDVEFSHMFRTVFPSSVVNGLVVTGDSTGLNVKVALGTAYVRGHRYASSAQETLAIAAGEANPRIDTVALRLDYGSTPGIRLAVLKGVASASPAAPSLNQTETGTFELPLANVSVPASAATIAAGNVTSRIVTWAAAFKAQLALVAADLPVVPISKGGTGAATLADAQTALGVAGVAGVKVYRVPTVQHPNVGGLAAGAATAVMSHTFGAGTFGSVPAVSVQLVGGFTTGPMEALALTVTSVTSTAVGYIIRNTGGSAIPNGVALVSIVAVGA